MAYNEEFAERVRALMKDAEGYSERKMFGGICYMINGNMACGVNGDDLMLRLTPEMVEAGLAIPDTRPMDFTGRPMKSMVFINSNGTSSDADLQQWIDMAKKHAASLPVK